MPTPDKQPVDRETLERARALRHSMTPWERRLWQAPRGRKLGGLRFRCQHPVPPYIVDVYCHSRRLAVELDGAYHGGPEQAVYDAARSAHLARMGIRVLRFTNQDVGRRLEGVLVRIAEACGVDGISPHPTSPQNGDLRPPR